MHIYSRHIHRHARGISFALASSVPAQLDRLHGQLAYATENNSGLEMLKQMHQQLMKYACVASGHLQAESLHSAHCTYSCVHVHYAVMHDMLFMRCMRATWAVSGTLEVPRYVHL